MRFKTILAIVLAVAGTAKAQSLMPHKDMVFAQVAVGDSIETHITLTNRGTAPYLGTLFLVKGHGEDWNAVVNKTQLTKGRISLTVGPGSTITLLITGTSTESGFAIVSGSDVTTASSLDGNLTYYVKSASGIVDSVGVQESTEIYFSSIPFEDFSALALALANTDAEERSTDVSISLFTENGTRVATQKVTLGSFSHEAFFVKELFAQTPVVGKGHLEVQTDIPICGTALNLVQGQMSSVPVSPSVRVYSVRATSADGKSFSGEANLWAEGYYVKGYMVISEANGAKIAPEPCLIYGRLIRGILRLSFYARGKAFQDREVSVYTVYRDFSFGSNSLSGTFTATYLTDNATSSGTFNLTKTN
ncbi:MAG TPA: hypothetical protein VGQ81_04470 [Acidobacteriota bacterium]|jgi:hypothetical protein|nr:hypothetical protein [Acidobacteriota bacterium]